MTDVKQPVRHPRLRLALLSLLLILVVAAAHTRRSWSSATAGSEGAERSKHLLEEHGAFVRQYEDGLTYVALADSHLSPSGAILDGVLINLRHFPRMFLDVRTTMINDVGMEQLAQLDSLEGLNVSETPITIAGLRHVGGMSRLKLLNLTCTHHCGDDAVVHLIRLERLDDLRLQGTEVSDAGVSSLAAALPRCKIEH
jgi:hypothetical protein